MAGISGVRLRLGINVKYICRNIGWNSYVFNKGTIGVSGRISERDTGELVATNAMSSPSIVFCGLANGTSLTAQKLSVSRMMSIPEKNHFSAFLSSRICQDCKPFAQAIFMFLANDQIDFLHNFFFLFIFYLITLCHLSNPFYGWLQGTFEERSRRMSYSNSKRTTVFLRKIDYWRGG